MLGIVFFAFLLFPPSCFGPGLTSGFIFQTIFSRMAQAQAAQVPKDALKEWIAGQWFFIISSLSLLALPSALGVDMLSFFYHVLGDVILAGESPIDGLEWWGKQKMAGIDHDGLTDLALDVLCAPGASFFFFFLILMQPQF
jgi:hypothetical protein